MISCSAHVRQRDSCRPLKRKSFHYRYRSTYHRRSVVVFLVYLQSETIFWCPSWRTQHSDVRICELVLRHPINEADDKVMKDTDIHSLP